MSARSGALGRLILVAAFLLVIGGCSNGGVAQQDDEEAASAAWSGNGRLAESEATVGPSGLVKDSVPDNRSAGSFAVYNLAGRDSVEAVNSVLFESASPYVDAETPGRDSLERQFRGPIGATALAAGGDATQDRECTADRCVVDLYDFFDRRLAQVGVRWVDGSVEKFEVTQIYEPSTNDTGGLSEGFGKAECGEGAKLVFGGSTPNNYDILVCYNSEDDQLHYHGLGRDDGLGIVVPACSAGSDAWQANNQGTLYDIVLGPTPQSSTITVTNPSGNPTFDQRFAVLWRQPIEVGASC